MFIRNRKGLDAEATSPKVRAEEQHHTPATDMITHSEEKVKRNLLKELRVENDLSARDMVEVVREKYPKYDKTLQTKCENGDKYGVDIRGDALEALYEKFAPGTLRRKKKDYHKKRKAVFCRFTDEEYDEIMKRIKADGFDTIQAWLTWVIRNILKGEHNGKS